MFIKSSRRALYRAAKARTRNDLAEMARQLWWSRYWRDCSAWLRGAEWDELRRGQQQMFPPRSQRRRRRAPKAFVSIEFLQ